MLCETYHTYTVNHQIYHNTNVIPNLNQHITDLVDNVTATSPAQLTDSCTFDGSTACASQQLRDQLTGADRNIGVGSKRGVGWGCRATGLPKNEIHEIHSLP